ncbi:hypothetical protein BDW69DRAFT_52192 [Aspergillus filifer]
MEIADACGEVTKSSHILQGRIKHLILNHTSGLRFEEPTTAELFRMHREAIERGEKQPQYFEGDGRKKIGFTFIPGLEPENKPVEGQMSQLRTLEIIENDALGTFVRMYAGLPHVVQGVTSLTLRSTEIPRDLTCVGEGTFLQIMSELKVLQTLSISVGEVFQESATLPSLWKNLPPNLTTLQFRGPLSFGRSKEFNEWVDAFSSDSFLPKLERLAFVLDYHYNKTDDGRPLKLDTPPEVELTEARAACERLYEAARQRGYKSPAFG